MLKHVFKVENRFLLLVSYLLFEFFRWGYSNADFELIGYLIAEYDKLI